MEGVFLIRVASWWAGLLRQGTWNWRPEYKAANNGLESGLLTCEKPPCRPLSPTYPVLSSPSPASQQPRERHVNLAPFERATGSGENKSAEVHGEFSQATARGFLSLRNCCCLCQCIPLFLTPSRSLHRSLPLFPSIVTTYFGNVTDRQRYSDVIVLITTSGRKRDSPLHMCCVWSGLVECLIESSSV